MSKPAKFSVIAAFRCAGRGAWLLGKGRNGRMQVTIAIVAIAAAFALRITLAEWMAVVLSIAMVLSLETANTAIERAVDLVSPGYHEMARDAKDLAAGAVLIASVASVAIGLLVFVPHLWRLL